MWKAFRHVFRRPGIPALLVVGMTLTAPPAFLRGQEASYPSPAGAILGGLLGGTAGFIAGAFIGGGDCDELCVEIFAGAVIGEMLGLPLGAHLGNSYRGSLLADLGVSVGVGGLGLLVASGLESVESGAGAVLLLTAIAQVTGVVLTEVRTSPRVTVAPAVGVVPEGVRVGMRVRW